MKRTFTPPPPTTTQLCPGAAPQNESGRVRALLHRLWLTILPAVLLASAVQARTLYVRPSGSDSAGTGSSARPWQNLLHAYARAAEGDEIILHGSFHSLSKPLTKRVTIRSVGATAMLTHPYHISPPPAVNLVPPDSPASPKPNQPPIIEDVTPNSTTLSVGEVVLLGAKVTDDGLPNPPGRLLVKWEQISGPVSVPIQNPNSAHATVCLTAPGGYSFRITANDGAWSVCREVCLGTYWVAVSHTDPEPPADTSSLMGLWADREFLPAPPILYPPVRSLDGKTTVRFSGAKGQEYEIQRSENLKDWLPWTGVICTASTSEVLDDETVRTRNCFYRLKLVQ